MARSTKKQPLRSKRPKSRQNWRPDLFPLHRQIGVRSVLRRCGSNLRSVVLVLGDKGDDADEGSSNLGVDNGSAATMSEDDAVAISLGKLLEGSEGLQEGLESLSVVTLWPAEIDPLFTFRDTPFERMPNLHALKIKLSVRALRWRPCVHTRTSST